MYHKGNPPYFIVLILPADGHVSTLCWQTYDRHDCVKCCRRRKTVFFGPERVPLLNQDQEAVFSLARLLVG